MEVILLYAAKICVVTLISLQAIIMINCDKKIINNINTKDYERNKSVGCKG